MICLYTLAYTPCTRFFLISRFSEDCRRCVPSRLYAAAPLPRNLTMKKKHMRIIHNFCFVFIVDACDINGYYYYRWSLNQQKLLFKQNEQRVTKMLDTNLHINTKMTIRNCEHERFKKIDNNYACVALWHFRDCMIYKKLDIFTHNAL